MPDPSGQVALVFSPRLAAPEALSAAAATGARIVRLGRFSWIVVVAPEPGDAGYTARAYQGGALALLNPQLAGGCPDPTQSSSSSRRTQ
ncbi:MAG TPA: hypothetical protein VE690_17620 [Rhodopila sp.]|nr:hypothetical protein [Rhodopila sp.]